MILLIFLFRKAVTYLIVFYFILHKINPLLHERVLKIAREISRNVMIVKPSPKGCPAYKLYSNIWRETMHSIVKFEDYKTLAYWKKLVKKSGFRILLLS